MKNEWLREHFGDGQVIFREGDVGEDAYLIERGQVRIVGHRGGEEKLLAVMGESEMFGEVALIDRMTRTAAAIAQGETTLIRISRSLVVDKLQRADPLLSHILQILVEHWRDALGMPGHEDGKEGEDGLHKLRDYAVSQLRIAQSLSDALERQEFEVFFQPIVHLSDGSLAGFEALVRWNRPGEGMVSPTTFVGIAEDTGLIVPIGRWVLQTALAAVAPFQEAMDRSHPGRKRLFMSINLSARQLQDAAELSTLAQFIRDCGSPPGQIKLEVTESSLIEDPDSAADALHRLKSLGVQLAIDDFGTGYSSLSYLAQYPLDSLKIDQSFVATMRESEPSRRITRAIASLAHGLGMNCIAEGIEYPSDAVALREMGSEYGQGYYFSRPLPRLRALEYIEARGGGAPLAET